MNRPYENLTEITRYEVLGNLPNPFLFEDGTPLKEVFAEYAEDEGIHASKFRELLLEYDRKEKK